MSNSQVPRNNKLIFPLVEDGEEVYTELSGPIQLIPMDITEMLNEKKYSIGSDKISSRILNHWYEMGIIKDDRPEGKGWKKFSISEIVWISIVIKLRGFGLDLKTIRLVREQFEYLNGEDPQAEMAILDLFLYDLLARKIDGSNTPGTPIKVIVFESGQAEIVGQNVLDIAWDLGGIKEDFISIDLGRILWDSDIDLGRLAESENWDPPERNPLIEQIQQSLREDDIQSLTIQIKNKEYILDKAFFTEDRRRASTLKSLFAYGDYSEKRYGGKTTFKIVGQKKIKRDNP